jgi:hypothetical protein
MTRPLSPQIAQLLDGEITLSQLPPELRAEGEAALKMIEAADHSPVTLSSELDARVMAAVRRRATRRAARAWRWLVEPREVRVRFRPWMLGPALAAAAAVTFLLARSEGPGPQARATSDDSVFVRFVLYAPDARQVALAGTFNEWDASAIRLVPGSDTGVWTTIVALPVGQHQYAFVIDGERWVADPAAPRVDDGFGRANSVMAVVPGGRTL